MVQQRKKNIKILESTINMHPQKHPGDYFGTWWLKDGYEYPKPKELDEKLKKKQLNAK